MSVPPSRPSPVELIRRVPSVRLLSGAAVVSSAVCRSSRVPCPPPSSSSPLRLPPFHVGSSNRCLSAVAPGRTTHLEPTRGAQSIAACRRPRQTHGTAHVLCRREHGLRTVPLPPLRQSQRFVKRCRDTTAAHFGAALFSRCIRSGSAAPRSPRVSLTLASSPLPPLVSRCSWRTVGRAPAAGACDAASADEGHSSEATRPRDHSGCEDSEFPLLHEGASHRRAVV